MEEILETNDTIAEETIQKLATAALNTLGGSTSLNPWSSTDVDKLELGTDDYNKIVKACRFFYRKDPLVSSTINKLVEVGVNRIMFSKSGLTDNEYKIFLGLREPLEEFAESMALEYLISGLVVPEIVFGRLNKEQMKQLGITGLKKYDSLVLPASMYIRDPSTIEIKVNPFGDKPSYFLLIPADVIHFIMTNGQFGDGTWDRDAYAKLAAFYPEFVLAVKNGETKILIEKDTDLILRRKPQTDGPNPTPYLSAALESLKHKRNLRRMDYAIAARVIGAIQLFKLGSDEFPVTEEDKDEQFGAIKDQMLWRDYSGKDIERIFQLFANHTLQVEWIVPDTQALLDEQKYISVNQDIIYALGFPRVLITGESEKTGTSDPQYAMMSPAKTMDNFRRKIIRVIQSIVRRVAEENKIKVTPDVKFKPLTLFDHQTLLKSLADLYAGANISRKTYAEELGYDWDDETDQRKVEKEKLTSLGLDEIAAQPFSAKPEPAGTNPDKKPSDVKNTSNNKNGEN